MRKLSSYLLIVLFTSGSLRAQQFAKDFEFLKHLENIEAYEEAFVFLEDMTGHHSAPGKSDTISYYRGKMSYLLRNRSVSIEEFGKVSKVNLNFWNGAQMYTALQYAYLQKYNETESTFKNTIFSEPVYKELLKYELASAFLLQRKFDAFEEQSATFDYQFFQLKDHQSLLLQSYERIKERKRKSPLVAGVMSSLIPGAGKMYIGQFGQGIMSLMTSTLFGLQAYEGYRKSGLNSAPFLIFGGLFSVFYVANIWGTVVAVRVDQSSFEEITNETILLHMHIPIRILFE